jgi:hypothetical protein
MSNPDDFDEIEDTTPHDRAKDSRRRYGLARSRAWIKSTPWEKLMALVMVSGTQRSKA